MRNEIWLAIGLAACGGQDRPDADTPAADADADTDAYTDADTDADAFPCADEDGGDVVPTSWTGTTAGAGDDLAGSCNPTLGGSDRAILFTPPADGRYLFETAGSSFDTVLYVSDSCDGGDLACDDDGGEAGASRLAVDLAAGSEVIVVVDGYAGTLEGPYTLSVASVPSTEPDCADGTDEDIDQAADCADPDCAAAPNCAPQCPDLTAGGFPTSVAGSTVGAPDESVGSCDVEGVSTPDASIAFTAPRDGLYGFALSTTATRFDSVLYVLDGCGGAELACSDALLAGGGESVGLSLLAGQTVQIVVDGYAGATGDFELLAFRPSRTEDCADGIDDDLDGLGDCSDPDCQPDAVSCPEDCTNGADDDLDGLIDCSDPLCGSEPQCIEDCANGTDDDGNGAVDCEDLDCEGDASCVEDCTNGADDDGDQRADCADGFCAADPACASVCPEDTLGAPPLQLDGTTFGQNDDNQGSCGGESASDRTFAFTAPATADYTFDTEGSAYDTLLVVLDSCGGAELGCNDDTVGTASSVTVALTAGQTVIVVVDGYGTSSGDFVLNVR